MLMTINNNGALSKTILIDAPTSGISFAACLHVTHIFVEATNTPDAIICLQLFCDVTGVVIPSINALDFSDSGSYLNNGNVFIGAIGFHTGIAFAAKFTHAVEAVFLPLQVFVPLEIFMVAHHHEHREVITQYLIDVVDPLLRAVVVVSQIALNEKKLCAFVANQLQHTLRIFTCALIADEGNLCITGKSRSSKE